MSPAKRWPVWPRSVLPPPRNARLEEGKVAPHPLAARAQRQDGPRAERQVGGRHHVRLAERALGVPRRPGYAGAARLQPPAAARKVGHVAAVQLQLRPQAQLPEGVRSRWAAPRPAGSPAPPPGPSTAARGPAPAGPRPPTGIAATAPRAPAAARCRAARAAPVRVRVVAEAEEAHVLHVADAYESSEYQWRAFSGCRSPAAATRKRFSSGAQPTRACAFHAYGARRKAYLVILTARRRSPGRRRAASPRTAESTELLDPQSR